MNDELLFTTEDRRPVPAVDEAQMREIDRIAVEEFGLGLLQMMENAGRALAMRAAEMVGSEKNKVIAVFAGTGGNGGGGLCAARHLHNWGYPIRIFLTREPREYKGAGAAQLHILQAAGVEVSAPKEAEKVLAGAGLVLDALIGYSLKEALKGSVKEYVEHINEFGGPVLSLDMPSGVDATSGDTPGAFVRAACTLTLALPKQGLANPAAGEIWLADIGIPPEAFERVGVSAIALFDGRPMLRLTRTE